ncbi:MAG: ATP-binding protein, partial [Raoultibacter sp.]
MIPHQDISLLINELRKLPGETELVEFKQDNSDPEMIARDISALANSAAHQGASCAYMIWGIEDTTHAITGTSFDCKTKKRGNEELENWLHHQLSNNASFKFSQTSINDKPIVLLEVQPAFCHTVDFESFAYIRIGSYTKKLKDYSAIEAEVWNKIMKSNYEEVLAKEDLSVEEVLRYLDYPKYFSLLKTPIPQSQKETVHYLCEDGILRKQDNGRFAITNLGALLFAHELKDFPSVARKALRIIQYQGSQKVEMVRERTSAKGYACDFESAIEFLMAIVPARERIDSALRQKQTEYPDLAIRETLANTLIHQDLTLSGNGPLVEIFENRIEFTNPGCPLVEILRLVDNPPRSRNQQLGSLLRRFNICEEAGTGWDKIIYSCEKFFLPAPQITIYQENGGNMKVTLFTYTPYSLMTSEARIMACYWHACIRHAGSTTLN